jgi:hypothetical protein
MAGGGDGGASDLRAQEADRQKKIQSAVDAINGQFASAGDTPYQGVQSATKEAATRDLDKQFTAASKNNLFGLARSGLLGGSVDAESGGDLQQRFGEGQIKAEQAGIGAASDLKAADERTRQNLIGLAQSGIDTGTAASLAAGQSASAAEAAKANAGSATVGRLFDDLGQAYLTNNALKARYGSTTPQQTSGSGYFGNLFSGKQYAGTAG